MKSVCALLLLSLFGSGLIYAQEPSTKIELNYGFWTSGNSSSQGFTVDKMLQGFDSEINKAVTKAQSELNLREAFAQTPSIEGVGIRLYPKQWVLNEHIRFSLEFSVNEVHSAGRMMFSDTYISNNTLDSTSGATFILSERNSYLGFSPGIHFSQTLFKRLTWESTLGVKTMFGTGHNQTYDNQSHTFYFNSTKENIINENQGEITNGNGSVNEWFIRTGLQVSVTKKIELGLALSMHRGVWNNYGAYKYRYINTGANIALAYALK
jgi:hypothetical protein